MHKKLSYFIGFLCFLFVLAVGTNVYAVSDPPAISSIVASNAGSNVGLGIGDTVAITFDQNTNKPTITAATIDPKLKLNKELDFTANIKDSDGTTAASEASGAITGTFTVTDLQAVINAAVNGGTVKLGENIDLGTTGVTVTDKTITLDLNDKTITYSGTGAAVTLSGTADLTVQDSGSDTGKITSASADCILINTGSGTLTLAGGTIEGTSTGSVKTFGIANNGTGRLNITGGTVQTTNMYALLINTNSGDVAISGGTLKTTNWGTINHIGNTAKLTISGNSLIENNSSVSNDRVISITKQTSGLEIQGGRIIGDSAISCYCAVDISGGYIVPMIATDQNMTITGGILQGGIAISGAGTSSVNGGYITGNNNYLKNADGVLLKRYAVQLIGADNNAIKDMAVTSLSTVDLLGYTYGLNDVKTDANGYLKVWLPEGKTGVSVTAGGSTYSGAVTPDASFYLGVLRLPSQNPAADTTSVAKTTASQASVDFTLTTAPTGTWKVYGSADATDVIAGVTAALSGTTLTLTASDGDIEAGSYYVTVAEPIKNESARLVLTVQAATVANAAAPVITHDLSNTQVEYSQNATATPLDATATVTDGGTISYAWYSNTTNSTAGATPLEVTTATYTPSTAAVTVESTYYYCVVTNTNNAATGTKTAQTTSAIANIRVNALVNAAQLAAALGGNATADGNTVTLTGNVADVANTIQIEPSENITLNLAGYSISGGKVTDVDGFDIGITPLKITGGTSTLTITGSGRILGGSVDIFSAADAISISGGTVVIENGSITGGVSNHGSGYQSCGDGIEISSGSLTIKGGAIKGGVDPNGYNYAGNGLNLRGGTVTIYAGSFYSGADIWSSGKAIKASGGASNETVADIIAIGKIMKSYTDEGFTTGEATIANDTSLSALTTKYIRVQAPVVNAESPVITNNLSTAQVQYSQNAAATALNATATVTDGGTISYQWYSNTTSSTVRATALGVTTATYTPSTTAAGTTYYYCVVTNTNNAATGTKTAQTTSAIANIKVKAAGGGSSGGGSSHSSTASNTPVITVSEVKSKLFSNAEDIKVEADVSSAFGQSVAVKITDNTESQKEVFSLAGAEDRVYPFDISLYSKGNGKKVQPRDGYSVKITMPVPEELLGDREKIKVVYGKDGRLETLKSELTEKDGKWYITFEAVHFSPYALVVSKEPPAKPWINPFSDVKEGDWYYSAVQYAAQNGLMNGTGSNTFSPEITTSRGMIATILYRLSGSEEAEQSTFKDVNPGAYYAKAVAWAQKKRIIAGYGNGMFGPDDSITREQLSAILWNYAGSPAAADSTGLAAFKDAGEISAYAKNALIWANQIGIINGKGGGLLDPKGKATRAEVAQIMQNFLQKATLIK